MPIRLVQIFTFDSHETVLDNFVVAIRVHTENMRGTIQLLKYSMFNVALFTRLMNIHAQLISSQVNRFAGADLIVVLSRVRNVSLSTANRL